MYPILHVILNNEQNKFLSFVDGVEIHFTAATF